MTPSTTSLREPGAILLLSCYELGHQPLGLAWPRAFLERAGFAPTTIDLAVEPLDETKVRRARLVAIAVPMHTALRLGVRAAQRIRQISQEALHVQQGSLYPALHRLEARGWIEAEWEIGRASCRERVFRTV